MEKIARVIPAPAWVAYAGLLVSMVGIGVSIWLTGKPTETATLLPWKAKVDAIYGPRAS